MDQEITLIGLSLTKSDWISVINIIVTSLIGIWLALIVQKNFTTNRAVKDYYIQEISEVRKLYVDFLNNIYKGRISAKAIKEWFKVVSNRIDCVEKSVNESFRIKNSDIYKTHSEIQSYITGTDEFNDGYRDEQLVFSESVKNEILIYHTKLLHCFMELVIKINHASKHGVFWKIKHCLNRIWE
ncbi:hypothetical protein K6V26_14655 [Parabacteroides goldsteinii]|uniref:hypothetical protein n=1 Tax=Parabacteroides goldsteinii TaxID=328812 RepID=UPI001CC9B800|nr:hypothetical protein [Parabacteroides goldsteinii]UBD77491.1 hypothetical protein K6V26_14655 [Parabacteroides goldsteinii]